MINHSEKNIGSAEETLQLVAAFKQGKTAAFDRLIEIHSDKLYRTVYALLGSRQDAEEVVQDAFLRAYRALGNFRGDSSFETWMHRIAVNLARNRFHWNRRRGEGLNMSLSCVSVDPDSDEKEEFLLPDERMRPDHELENAEFEHSVMHGLASLPDSLRETMILRHVNDLPYEKIAEKLECKIGTVKSRLARGRDILRGYLRVGYR